ncbi:diacylglycerol kinase family protein [Polyangium sp. y55x31]|uniref:diacylglycerol/lipid kinase family protein n=1 Tax=Polyangium sp. y55x31 TaxID=3042688 RepID=UPI002482DF66|nr:diacylglycerol kinase family protein [Polyangium sp. y55x31]MDI1481923.1 diacylglycerol kinase family protein [Polyangium sp. y55x31]
MRFDVIANITARLYRRRPSLLDEVRRVSAGVAEVHPTSRVDELDAVCARIAARGTDLVILSGGDGSFMAGVTALARAFGEASLPRLALLPGGTVATVARNFGMQGDPTRLLARIFAARTLASRRRATLRVREGAANERIGFIFGTGLVARFFDLYYADGARGYGGAARIAGRIFVESFVDGPYAQQVLTPMPCTIEVDGRRLASDRWSLVCASVVRDLGIGMRVNYRAGEDLHRPHLVASPLPPRSLGPRAPLVLLGKSIGGAGSFDDLARSFVVRFSPEGPYVLDGDVLRASEVTVSAGPPIDVVTL